MSFMAHYRFNNLVGKEQNKPTQMPHRPESTKINGRKENWKMEMLKKIAGKLRWKCERMAAFHSAANEPQYNLNQNKLSFIISKIRLSLIYKHLA